MEDNVEGTSEQLVGNLRTTADDSLPEKNLESIESVSAPGATGEALEVASSSRTKSFAPSQPKREDADIEPRPEAEISLRSLLQAGVHFGHQTSRWNPAMSRYIYTARNGIHIIDLPHTIQCWKKARAGIVDVVSKGGKVLFVGTKKQAQDAIIEEARRCGAYYVAKRWLGGMLTNFQTIRKSIDRMNKLEAVLTEEEKSLSAGLGSKFTKKERLMMSRELEKLTYSLGGIRDMHRAPDLIFVVDIKREDIAVNEGVRLDVPVVALVDTNCDPALIQYPIPSNDDGTRSIRLFAEAIADAVMEGKRIQAERKLSVTEGAGNDKEEKKTSTKRVPKKAARRDVPEAPVEAKKEEPEASEPEAPLETKEEPKPEEGEESSTEQN